MYKLLIGWEFLVYDEALPTTPLFVDIVVRSVAFIEETYQVWLHGATKWYLLMASKHLSKIHFPNLHDHGYQGNARTGSWKI
jgi:hypothetical protein